MTLPEMMVSVAVGCVVLMVMAIVFTSSARSFVSLGNYVSMNRNSRNALDRMSREIRRAGDLTEFSPTHLKFARYGMTNSFLVYSFTPGSRQLTEWMSGTAKTNILLSECDQLAFSMHKTTFATTTNISEAKGVSLTWKCSRLLLGKQLTTEDIEQALIIIRNKPI